MPVYDIYRVTTCRERHSVDAPDPVTALRKFNDGDATLKDDEVLEVHNEKVVDRATDKDVSDAAFALYEEE